MTNPTDQKIAELAAEWPNWQFWVVPGVPGVTGPPTWCARRWEDVGAVPAKVLNAGSAAELAGYIEAEVSR